ncbi:MAG: HEAT repeat domain-containing protein, partial [Planctomycetota bacterium]
GQAASAEDRLPPVQPPSASFIMQLFLIPLLIVIIIVSVWLLFSWLAHKGTNPTKLVDEIERLNHSSWQRALTLAQQLQDSTNVELRGNSELSGRLADVLTSELETGSNNDRRVMLRVYLCKALGEFDVDAGVPALVLAANTERDEHDLKVRQAALQAIGFYAGRTGGPAFAAAHPDALDAVLQASEESDLGGPNQQARDRLRYNAAFTLGIFGDATSIGRLKEMLLDPSNDVKFNAAAGLARNGVADGAEILMQMLSVSDEELLRGEKVDPEQEASWVTWKRDVVAETALQSIQRLTELNEQITLAEFADALQSAAQNDQLGKTVRVQAESFLRQLEQSADAVPAT